MYKKYLVKAIFAYFGLLFLWFIYSLLLMQSSWLRDVSGKFVQQDLALVLGENHYTGEIRVQGVSLDRDDRFRDDPVEDLNDVDVWVFLLENLEDIKEAPFARDLGIDTDKVAQAKRGTMRVTHSTALSFRLHPFPLTVRTRQYVILDGGYLVEEHGKKCLPAAIHAAISGEPVKQRAEECKLSNEES